MFWTQRIYLVWRWTVGGREEPGQDGALFTVLVGQESPELSVEGAAVDVRHGDDVALLEVLALGMDCHANVKQCYTVETAYTVTGYKSLIK